MLLSVPVVWLLRAAIESTVISAALPNSFSWFALAVWIPAAIVIGALGATQPARMAARLTIRDTLAYEPRVRLRLAALLPRGRIADGQPSRGTVSAALGWGLAASEVGRCSICHWVRTVALARTTG